jgi:DNA polymerase alpha subunit A
VNKKYRLLEIDMDGVYKRMLLLKKKKYAAVKVLSNSDGTMREVIEQKGLDIVRRDWSSLSKDIGNYCLDQILSGRSREDVVEAIHSQLRKVGLLMKTSL